MSELITNFKNGILKTWLDAALSNVAGFVWSVILALIVWWVGVKFFKFVRKVATSGMRKRNVDEGVVTFTGSVLRIAGYVVLLVIILGLFGISASSIAAAVAALGLTAGLSLQGALSNLAGGILILVLKPFKVGDYIIEDTNKNEGTVDSITIFYTTLHSVDNKKIVVPNGTLANASLVNASTMSERKVSERVGVSYDSDIDKVKEILTRCAVGNSFRLADYDVTVVLDGYGESAINMLTIFSVKPADYRAARWEFLESVKHAFDKAGVVIPFSQVNVHLDGSVTQI